MVAVSCCRSLLLTTATIYFLTTMSGQLEDNEQKNSTPPNDRTTHFHRKLGLAWPVSQSEMMTNENHQENKPLTPISNLSCNATDLNTNIDLGLLGLCIGMSDLYFYGSTVSLSFLT